jgi:hypothetical protein
MVQHHQLDTFLSQLHVDPSSLAVEDLRNMFEVTKDKERMHQVCLWSFAKFTCGLPLLPCASGAGVAQSI